MVSLTWWLRQQKKKKIRYCGMRGMWDKIRPLATSIKASMRSRRSLRVLYESTVCVREARGSVLHVYVYVWMYVCVSRVEGECRSDMCVGATGARTQGVGREHCAHKEYDIWLWLRRAIQYSTSWRVTRHDSSLMTSHYFTLQVQVHATTEVSSDNARRFGVVYVLYCRRTVQYTRSTYEYVMKWLRIVQNRTVSVHCRSGHIEITHNARNCGGRPSGPFPPIGNRRLWLQARGSVLALSVCLCAGRRAARVSAAVRQTAFAARLAALVRRSAAALSTRLRLIARVLAAAAPRVPICKSVYSTRSN